MQCNFFSCHVIVGHSSSLIVRRSPDKPGQRRGISIQCIMPDCTVNKSRYRHSVWTEKERWTESYSFPLDHFQNIYQGNLKAASVGWFPSLMKQLVCTHCIYNFIKYFGMYIRWLSQDEKGPLLDEECNLTRGSFENRGFLVLIWRLLTDRF